MLAGIAGGKIGNLSITVTKSLRGAVFLLVPGQPLAVPWLRNAPGCPAIPGICPFSYKEKPVGPCFASGCPRQWARTCSCVHGASRQVAAPQHLAASAAPGWLSLSMEALCLTPSLPLEWHGFLLSPWLQPGFPTINLCLVVVSPPLYHAACVQQHLQTCWPSPAS